MSFIPARWRPYGVPSGLVSVDAQWTWTTVARHQSGSSDDRDSDPPRTAYTTRGAATTTPRPKREILS